MEQEKDLYFVAVKVFLEDGKGNFLITKDRFGDWDIPGGRLRGMDFETPLEEVIERKMHEELGEQIRYQLGKPIIFMRHERDELLPSGERAKRRIFAVGYRASYESSDIVLGENHETHEWVPLASFIPAERFAGGWRKGVEEYLTQEHGRSF